MTARIKSRFILIIIFSLVVFSFTGCDIETSESINEEINMLEMEIEHLQRQKAELANIHEEINELKKNLVAVKEEIENFKAENPETLEYLRENPPRD